MGAPLGCYATKWLYNPIDAHQNSERKLTGEYGGIAQLGERLLCKQEVSGSIPLISTIGLKKTSQTYGLIAQPVRAHA